MTRKVTRAVARIALGMEPCLYLGNLDAQRDWGHARDYVEGMWRIVQHPTPDDWVLATGITTSVRVFCEKAFASAGLAVAWEGEGVDEVGRRTDSGETVVRIDPRYHRPTEVDLLMGQAAKAQRELGWTATCTLDEMVAEMVASDLDEARGIVKAQPNYAG